jgi:hypothetical protein
MKCEANPIRCIRVRVLHSYSSTQMFWNLSLNIVLKIRFVPYNTQNLRYKIRRLIVKEIFVVFLCEPKPNSTLRGLDAVNSCYCTLKHVLLYSTLC